MRLDSDLAHRVMWVIWPAFLVAGAAEIVFFTIFDPFDLHFFGAPLDLSREGIYTLGFFGFWALGIASSALTAFLERSPFEVNRCTIAPHERPVGCPKREAGACVPVDGSASATRDA
ncbi:hypothetical protein BURK1_01342 [Burkholderiales bacterium]|nr:hypothetical protein BURK1_01342 [Burkholderiales bacterium]